MCGIAGLWRWRTNVTPREIYRMSEAISHRGPDDAGHVLIDTKGRLSLMEVSSSDTVPDGYDLALANRRLSIIDLSASGHQPMTRDGCTVVYNGEIYNYLELKRELTQLGRLFTSTSDTEVLLQAYLEWGPACLHHLNGMFAFALWDDRQRRLFCARDRMGIKPFYYSLTERNFLFASEIKAILPLLDKQPDLNEGVMYDYLAAGWLDHTQETFFKGIVKLPAGHYMMVDNGGVSLSPYWQLTRHEASSRDFAENVEQFRTLFENAVALQMRSDVAVGCCLSGGMDSSAIVGVAAPLSPHQMRTFTARYHDPSMDEWHYVQHVAQKTSVDAKAVFASPENFWHFLPELTWVQEEPFAGPSVYAQWQLMQMIRDNKISVVLDGQGADEILCGYAKFFYYYLLEMWGEKRIGTMTATLWRALFNGGMHLLQLGSAKRYLPQYFGNHRRRTILHEDFQNRNSHRGINRPGGDLIEQQRLDIEKYSLPILLRYEDKNSMAHSVESRVPFLDHRLVEFAVNLPSDHKFWGGKAKRIMRTALSDVLPEAVLTRRTKLGFGGTFASWVQALHPYFRDWLDSDHEAIDPYVSRKALLELLQRKDPGLFLYIILDRWLMRFGYSG